jgi:hypothetical protein
MNDCELPGLAERILPGWMPCLSVGDLPFSHLEVTSSLMRTAASCLDIFPIHTISMTSDAYLAWNCDQPKNVCACAHALQNTCRCEISMGGLRHSSQLSADTR